MQLHLLRSLLCLLLLTDTSVASRSTRAAIKLLGVVDDAISAALEGVDGASQKPLVTVSYAQTLDGSIAPLERTRLDISSNYSFQLLHSLRARHDAVLIGVNTLLFDTPRLNVRTPLPGVEVGGQPRPIVIDSGLRLLDAGTILLERPIFFTCIRPEGAGGGGGETGVGTGAGDRWTRAQERVWGLGGDLVSCRPDAQGRCDLGHCLQILAERFGVRSVLVEGGAGIIQSVLEGGLAHQVVLTLRPCFFGGYRSLTRQLRRPVGMTSMQAASIGGDI
ncbi:dihydrofolate reductase-like domain-containing protein, partial [Ochromonadaceae sp. CCMP2298]